jgi:hypothetical protein
MKDPMPLTPEHLAGEAASASNLLRHKIVSSVVRHRENEVMIEFTDGTRLFVDRSENGVELSINGGPDD